MDAVNYNLHGSLNIWCISKLLYKSIVVGPQFHSKNCAGTCIFIFLHLIEITSKLLPSFLKKIAVGPYIVYPHIYTFLPLLPIVGALSPTILMPFPFFFSLFFVNYIYRLLQFTRSRNMPTIMMCLLLLMVDSQTLGIL